MNLNIIIHNLKNEGMILSRITRHASCATLLLFKIQDPQDPENIWTLTVRKSSGGDYEFLNSFNRQGVALEHVPRTSEQGFKSHFKDYLQGTICHS